MIIALSAGRDSPLELRTRLALTDEQQRTILRSRARGIGELAILVTCHRTEVYATADGRQADAVHALAAVLPGLLPTDQHDVRFLDGIEAVEHLFRVASGLDSLVIGEPQVVGQVRRALVMAQEEGTAGPMLQSIFGRALRLGRRVRAQTMLGSLAASVGTIAADWLALRFGGLAGRRGLVVGAGEAATDAARALGKAGAELEVISRSRRSAVALASQVRASALAPDELQDGLARSEFAVVAVAGGNFLRREHVAPRSKPLVLLDLSVPRAVESPLPGVEIRSLEELPGPRTPEIAAAVIEAEAMVRRELLALERWVETRASGPAIRDLREWSEGIVRDEVARAVASADLTPDQVDRVTAMATRIVNKLMHGPTVALREADEATRELVRQLFTQP